MCFSNFEKKILDEISKEEQEKWIFEYDDNDIEKTFTDQKFIEKVWYACVHHGYISEDYDVMGKLLDTMRIVLYIYCIGSRRIRLNNCLWGKHVVERYYQHLVNKQFGQRRPFDLRLDALSRGKKHNTRNTRR